MDISIFFAADCAIKARRAPRGCAFDPSFACLPAASRYNRPLAHHTFNALTGGHVNVHRFEEVINGREYHIEVSSVGFNKWRAQIARTPGGSTAMMPFYGKTPDEAAQHLSRWLSIAHGQTRPRL